MQRSSPPGFISVFVLVAAVSAVVCCCCYYFATTKTNRPNTDSKTTSNFISKTDTVDSRHFLSFHLKTQDGGFYVNNDLTLTKDHTQASIFHVRPVLPTQGMFESDDIPHPFSSSSSKEYSSSWYLRIAPANNEVLWVHETLPTYHMHYYETDAKKIRFEKLSQEPKSKTKHQGVFMEFVVSSSPSSLP